VPVSGISGDESTAGAECSRSAVPERVEDSGTKEEELTTVELPLRLDAVSAGWHVPGKMADLIDGGDVRSAGRNHG